MMEFKTLPNNQSNHSILREVGKKFLQFLLYKLIYLNPNTETHSLYPKLHQNFSSIIAKYLQIDKPDLLEIGIGNMIKHGRYSLLSQLQAQLSIIISLQYQKFQSPRSNNNEICNPNLDTNNFPYSISICNKLIKFDPSYMVLDKGDNEPPYIKNPNQHQKNQPLKIVKNPQKNKQSKRFDSFAFTSNDTSNTLTIQKQSPQSISISQYLQTKIHSYKSELNFVIQQKHLIRGQWSDEINQHQRVQQYYLIVPANITGTQQMKITGIGKDMNKKKAGEKTALRILETLYNTFPNILKSIQSIKEELHVRT